MDKLKRATTASLSDYPKITIASMKDKLGQHANAIRMNYFLGASHTPMMLELPRPHTITVIIAIGLIVLTAINV